jgi:hypothetical protein
MNATMRRAITNDPFPGLANPATFSRLTTDGVHMNPRGNQMMARALLKRLGVSDAAIDAMEDRWMTMADAFILKPNVRVETDSGPNGKHSACHAL